MQWTLRSKQEFFRNQPASQSSEVSLFDAVRKWTDAEGEDGFDIELDGKRLTSEQIQAIAHSEVYKDRLLAFNERLA
jgi:hypothetical protein